MSAVSIAAVMVLAVAVNALAVGAKEPEAVSPGGAAQLALVGNECPTFSWTAVQGAERYELVVYAVAEGNSESTEVVRRELPGGATSWTPSLDECLQRGGRYAWTVRVVGKQSGWKWSVPSLFEVADGPSRAEFEEALMVVRSYLAGAEDGAESVPNAPELTVSGEPERAATGAPETRAAPAATQLSVDGNIDATSYTGDGENLSNVATDAELGAHDHLGGDGAAILHSSLGSVGTSDHHTPPTSLPPSGAAGGDLAGSYPNPTVGSDAVGSVEITDNSVGEIDLAFDPATQAELDGLFPAGGGVLRVMQCASANGWRYYDFGDGTVLDCNTGLIWLKDASCADFFSEFGDPPSWDQAETAVASLADGACGLSDGSSAGDWRQPTIDEYCSAWAGSSLIPCPAGAGADSLVDSSLGAAPYVMNAAGTGLWTPGDVFVGVESLGYWSSTESGALEVWTVSLSSGNVNKADKVFGARVWPVRGGN